MAHFVCLRSACDPDLWPFDFESGAQRSTCHWVHFCQFWWTTTIRFRFMGQHGSDWSHDLATLTFDLGGHGACGWCGSSSSIRVVPNLKSVGLAIRKIWCTMCVNINGPGEHDLWPFDLETFMQIASKVRNIPCKFGHTMPLGSRIIRYVRNGRTDRDGRTDKSNAYCPLPYRGGA